jgi:hypothetical protein
MGMKVMHKTNYSTPLAGESSMGDNEKNPDGGLLGSSYLIWAARDCGLVVGTAPKKKGKRKGVDEANEIMRE